MSSLRSFSLRREEPSMDPPEEPQKPPPTTVTPKLQKIDPATVKPFKDPYVPYSEGDTVSPYWKGLKISLLPKGLFFSILLKQRSNWKITKHENGLPFSFISASIFFSDLFQQKNLNLKLEKIGTNFTNRTQQIFLKTDIGFYVNSESY